MKIDAQYYAKSQVKSKKKSLHVHRHPIFHAKSGEDQKKKRSLRPQTPIFRAKSGEESKLEQEKKKNVADVQLFAQNQVQKIHPHEMLKYSRK